MNKKYLFLLPILSLGLFGCAAPSNTDSLTSADTSTGVKESSSEKDTVTTESQTATNWDEETINLMKAHLNNNVIPYAPIEGAVWSYDEVGDSVEYIKHNATEADVTTFKDKILSFTGWEDITDPEFPEITSLILPLEKQDLDETLCLDIEFYDGTFYAYAYYWIFDTEWNQTKADEFLHGLGAAEIIALPKPNFEFKSLAFYGPYEDGTGILDIHSDETNLNAYKTQLVAAGYQELDLEGDILYTADSIDYGFMITYDADYNAISLLFLMF